jgi:hypothetical protein
MERLYNRGEALLGNRERPFDAALRAAGPGARPAMLAAWQPRAARILRRLSPVSANGRTLAIYLAVLAGEPLLYCLWEIVALTLLSLAAASALRQAESLAEQPAAPQPAAGIGSREQAG